jgi:hypothetical protein
MFTPVDEGEFHPSGSAPWNGNGDGTRFFFPPEWASRDRIEQFNGFNQRLVQRIDFVLNGLQVISSSRIRAMSGYFG